MPIWIMIMCCLYPKAFEKEYNDFKKKILDFEYRLANVLCLAFRDCSELESTFKVRIQLHIMGWCWLYSWVGGEGPGCDDYAFVFQLLTVVGPFLDRGQIRQIFSANLPLLRQLFRDELEKCKCLYKSHLNQVLWAAFFKKFQFHNKGLSVLLACYVHRWRMGWLGTCHIPLEHWHGQKYWGSASRSLGKKSNSCLKRQWFFWINGLMKDSIRELNQKM